MKISGRQIRAARALLGMSSETLAKSAELGIATIRRAEAVDDAPPITPANLSAIRSALERAGIEFTNGTGQGIRLVGVTLAEAPAPKSTKAKSRR